MENELRLPREAKSSRMGFLNSVHSKRKTKVSVASLLNTQGEILTNDQEEAEELLFYLCLYIQRK